MTKLQLPSARNTEFLRDIFWTDAINPTADAPRRFFNALWQERRFSKSNRDKNVVCIDQS